MFNEHVRVMGAIVCRPGCVFELTCVDAVLVNGAVAVNGDGDASEGIGCCCCDNSELAPPMATAPVPVTDPSAPEKTPVERPEIANVHHLISFK